MTSVPDVAVCETLLNQLRSGTVACSFVQVCLLLAARVRAAACEKEGSKLLSLMFTSREESSACPRPLLVLYLVLSSAVLSQNLLNPSCRWAVSTHTIAALATFPMWN